MMATSNATRREILGIVAALPAALSCSSARSTDALAPARFSLTSFGGAPDLLDNAAAFRATIAALSARGGGVLEIGAGIYRIAAASVGTRGITLPSNIRISGAGKGKTMLQVTGTTVCNLFVAMNQSNVAFEDLTLVGNNAAVDPGYGNGAAICWTLNSAATASVSGFTLRRVHLENFRGNYWIDIENDCHVGRALEMGKILIDAVTFTSRPGNAIRPDSVTHNSSTICVNGYSGIVRNVHVIGLSGDARHIKTGIILYRQVIDARLDDVVIAAAGHDGATDDAGAYAIQIYDPTGIMASIIVTRPVITNPRSVGIYVAGGANIAIHAPIISGQTDQRSGTLPKGAIVFNGTRDWEVIGGQLHGNWRDIAISPPPGGTRDEPMQVRGRVEWVQGQGARDGVAIGYLAGAVSAGITFRNCRWHTAGRTVSVQNSAGPILSGSHPEGGYLNGIVFEDCQFEAGKGFRAIDLWNGSSSPADGYVVRRCRLVGTNPLYARGQTGSLLVEGCDLRDVGTEAEGSVATFVDCPRLDLRDCVFTASEKGGTGVNLAGSRGSIRRLRFVGCASALPRLSSPQLGHGKPQFVGSKGQYVQNLALAPGDAEGWLCDGGTAWRQAPTPIS